MARKIIAGLDEAGRGPVLGPLVIGCVLFYEDELHYLEEEKITDSKQLSPQSRKNMAEKIRSKCIEYQLIEITAEQIDSLHEVQTLNVTEVKGFAKALNSLKNKPDEIYLDAADVKEERFGIEISKLLDFKPKKVIAKHKGDSIFRIVGAASILAKVHRDNRIEEFKKDYGDIGSGYPSDPYTKKFLKEYMKQHKKLPKIVRHSWKTAENIKTEFFAKKQKRLDDF